MSLLETAVASKKKFSWIYVSALVAIWWGANSYYAVHAQNLLRNATTPFPFAELTFVQLLIGLCMSMARLTYQKRSLQTSSTWILPQVQALLKSRSFVPLCVGFSHFLGTTFTNMSYAILGSTPTLVWKLSEPFSVVALKWLILRKQTSTCSLTGVLHLVTGVMIFSRSGVTGLADSPIIVANLAYPARNVASKLYQESHPESLSTPERFLRMHLCCVPFLVLGIVAKTLLYGIDLKALRMMTENAVLFNMYQFASLELLDMLDPLTHAVGNTLKRVSGVMLSVMLTGDLIVGQQKDGLGMTCVGLLLYFIGEKGDEIPKRIQMLLKGISLFLSALITIDTISRGDGQKDSSWILTRVTDMR